MRRHALVPIALACLLVIGGCCSARVCTPVDGPVIADLERPAHLAEPAQILLDVQTFRIPENDIKAVLADLVPTTATATHMLDAKQVDALRTRLAKHAGVKVLQAPKMLSLDGQEGSVHIGESIRFARTEAGDDGTLAITESAGSPVFIGFQLRVVPTWNDADATIGLDVVESARRVHREPTEQELAGMDGRRFLRDHVVSHDHRATLRVPDGGHALTASPEIREDEDGRFLRVTLLTARRVVPTM